MMVRIEAPGVVSTWDTTTAGGTSTGFCGLGRVRFCACNVGASSARAAPTRSSRKIMSRAIYLIRSDTPQKKAAEGFLSAARFSIGFTRLTLQMELERHLDELCYFLPPDLRRREFHAGERFLDGGGKRWVAGA